MSQLIFKKLLVAISVVCVLVSCSEKKKATITIATAANMQFAMNEITTKFFQQTGVKCEVIVSSSGKLTAQIKEGAPYDIFISADLKFPNELFVSGFTIAKPTVYAYGKLVIWTLNENIQPSFEILKSNQIKHIAVANPKTAPYGLAAEEVLKKEGLFQQIEEKLVYGESIAQTNQFITTQAAEIGFTAKSVVLSPNIKGKGTWIEINNTTYAPISQGVVLLKNGTGNKNHAQQFFNFLLSAEGREILNNFGYSTSK
jgi:molybdate transport system substrate-binding protein